MSGVKQRSSNSERASILKVKANASHTDIFKMRGENNYKGIHFSHVVERNSKRKLSTKSMVEKQTDNKNGRYVPVVVTQRDGCRPQFT